MSPNASRDCMQHVAAVIGDALGPDWKLYRSRLELRTPSCGGENVIRLCPATRFSPSIWFNVTFGRFYPEVRRVKRLCGWQPSFMHVDYNTYNVRHMERLSYSGPVEWDLDVRDPLPATLVPEVLAAVEDIAVPFFERFATIDSARDAFASGDSWVIGGPVAWRRILLLDAVLDDFGHFEEWSAVILEHDQRRAAEALATVRLALGHSV